MAHPASNEDTLVNQAQDLSLNDKYEYNNEKPVDYNHEKPVEYNNEKPVEYNNEEPVASERPRLPTEPSRSYAKPIPIVTTYDPDLSDNASVRRRSKPASVRRASSTRNSVALDPPVEPPVARAQSVRAQSVRAQSVRAPSVRSPSRAGSVRNSGAANVGEVVSPSRQRQMQGVALEDNGAVPHFEEDRRTASPRPQSAFGYRPQPNLISVMEDGRESRFDDSRMGTLNRNGTVVSRANTLGRNGTLSRAANGGTVGSRRGAFGRGAGASIGTQPEEVLGRDDIHTRAELSERILDDATLRRLSTMEKKDAKRLSKVIKSEGKAEAAAVKGSIKELERLSHMQKSAAAAERKSQMRLSKHTAREHKARLRFLKEKERYERIEGELRNAENDYEERRDHAAGLTSQVAEKTQELDDLRGQKAADDRERAVKLLALKNPGHS